MIQCRQYATGPALNEGREVNPDDTRRLAATRRRACRPLNEGREVNPDDTGCISRDSTTTRPLNEGREVNPDDTKQYLPNC